MITRPTDARTSILDAAERLFAERGFKSTTIKSIGTESSQNTALIYYYFDNKATLYRHILARVLGDLEKEGQARTQPNAEPEEVVRAIVESQVAVLSSRPHLPALVAREMIEWQAAHAENAVRQLAGSLFHSLCEAIEKGQRELRFRADLNPKFAAISVVAQVAYVMLARPVAGVLLGRGLKGLTNDDIREFGRHAAEFAIAALRANDDAVL